MKRLIVVATLIAIAAPGWAAKPSSSKPPSAVVFNGFYSFNAATPSHKVSIGVPTDGAWLTGTGSWNNMPYPYWDCGRTWSATLNPNANDYTPLFTAGWLPHETCVNQYPVFGCLTCGVKWGGLDSFPSSSMTTSNRPGFVAGGIADVILVSHNGGGQNDVLVLFVEQFNRDAMASMRVYQSVDEEDPAPASTADINAAYYIADSADRVSVVAVFEYGPDSNGVMREFPAGPGFTWSAIWDSGAATSAPEERFAPQGLHGHSILAVPVPKLPTGKHSFVLEGRLPSGKTYTSAATTVMVYAQNIYITVEGTFAPKSPQDQLPQFVPGETLNGTHLDLRTGPQMVQLNILVGRGSSGTFDVKLANVSRYPGITMNYPAGATDTNPDMDFGAGDTELYGVPIPKGGAPKVVKLPLYIRDYAASATIEVTMPYRKTTFSTRRTVPRDDDGNQLPDGGWHLPTGTDVAAGGLSAAGDVDDAVSASNTQPGDGLSNFEEYRGFLVQGQYTRTDPRRKDLFLDVDPEILSEMNAITVFSTLPLHLLYLDPDEVVGQDVANRFERGRPIVNSNRQGIPGARPAGKRAVRIVYQLNDPPRLRDPVTQKEWDAWRLGILGIAIPDEFVNVTILTDPLNVEVLHSPDHVQVVEIYPRAFNRALHTDFTAAYRDAAGNLVPDCATVTPGTPCDHWDVANQLILPDVESVPGLGANAFFLHTVLDPDRYPFPDWYTKPLSMTCSGGVVPETIKGLSDDQMMQLRAAYAGHELGHAVHMGHTSLCGNIMYDNVPAKPRQTMADVLPIFGNFTGMNVDQILLTEP